MERHLRMAGMLSILYGVLSMLSVLIGLTIGRIVRLPDLSNGALGFLRSLSAWDLGIFALLMYGVVLAVPAIVCGIGMIRLNRSVQGMATLTAALMVLSVPLGTALGCYMLWVLMAEETILLFSYQSKSEERLFRSR